MHVVLEVFVTLLWGMLYYSRNHTQLRIGPIPMGILNTHQHSLEFQYYYWWKCVILSVPTILEWTSRRSSMQLCCSLLAMLFVRDVFPLIRTSYWRHYSDFVTIYMGRTWGSSFFSGDGWSCISLRCSHERCHNHVTSLNVDVLAGAGTTDRVSARDGLTVWSTQKYPMVGIIKLYTGRTFNCGNKLPHHVTVSHSTVHLIVLSCWTL